MNKNRERNGPQRISSKTLSEIDENVQNRDQLMKSCFVEKPMGKQTKSHGPVPSDPCTTSSKNVGKTNETVGGHYVLKRADFVQNRYLEDEMAESGGLD